MPALPLLLALLTSPPPHQEARMTFESPAFANGARMPTSCTADGPDLSPALRWGPPPPGTRAFLLLVEDPDAPAGTWIHWVVYDLPAEARQLTENQPRLPDLPGGGRQGRNSWGRLGWNGPSPPPGRPHRYVFRLQALSAPVGLAAGASWAQVSRAASGRILAESTWTGTYGR